MKWKNISRPSSSDIDQKSVQRDSISWYLDQEQKFFKWVNGFYYIDSCIKYVVLIGLGGVIWWQIWYVHTLIYHASITPLQMRLSSSILNAVIHMGFGVSGILAAITGYWFAKDGGHQSNTRFIAKWFLDKNSKND